VSANSSVQHTSHLLDLLAQVYGAINTAPANPAVKPYGFKEQYPGLFLAIKDALAKAGRLS
jgi:hypothetical protein